MVLARAAPPFRPIAAAAGSLPRSSGVGCRSSTWPVAISTTSLAAWEKSLGRLRCFDIATACKEAANWAAASIPFTVVVRLRRLLLAAHAPLPAAAPSPSRTASHRSGISVASSRCHNRRRILDLRMKAAWLLGLGICGQRHGPEHERCCRQSQCEFSHKTFSNAGTPPKCRISFQKDNGIALYRRLIQTDPLPD
jgi:hypothetical protein